MLINMNFFSDGVLDLNKLRSVLIRMEVCFRTRSNKKYWELVISNHLIFSSVRYLFLLHETFACLEHHGVGYNHIWYVLRVLVD